MKRVFALTLVCSLCLGCATQQTRTRNVVLLIGDGMGFEAVHAARCFQGAPLSFENFTNQGSSATCSASAPVTDSAAGATAIATGHKVANGVISIANPGDEHEYPTLLEVLQRRGKSTGLVSTKFLTDATPAAFGAHASNRAQSTDIASDYFTQTKPYVLLGGGAAGITPQAAISAGYVVVTNRAGLLALDTERTGPVSGQFGPDNMPCELDGMKDLPHLSEMADVALRILDNDPDGFFVMIEGALIDKAGHANQIECSVREVSELSKTVATVLNWASNRTDTLVVVTADHETGGLRVTQDNGPGKEPTVTWQGRDHTPTNVPVFAWGAGSGSFTGKMDNTDLFKKIIEAVRIKTE